MKNTLKNLINTIKNKKISILGAVIFLTTITFIFFSYKAYFSPDSCYYYYFSLMFDNTVSFSKWWSVRGFTLPLYLFVSTKLFGNTPMGILIGLYILYLSTQLLILAILKKVIKYEKWEKYKSKIYIIYFLLLIINPLIIGYSHLVLTESMAPLLALLAVYLCINWYSIDIAKNHVKKILYVLGLGILTIVMWYLKQPYLPVVVIIILCTTLCSIISEFKIKNVLYRLLSLIGIFMILLFGMKTWDYILKKNNVNNSLTESYVTNGFLYALNYHYIQDKSCSLGAIQNSKLDADEKEIALELVNNNACNDFVLYNVVDDEKQILDSEIIFVENSLGSIDSLKFVLKQTFRHPLLLVDSYYNNYMATIGLHGMVYEDGGYKATDDLQLYENENKSLGMFIFYDGPSYWWKWYIDDNDYDAYLRDYEYGLYMKQFEVQKDVNENMSSFFISLFDIYNNLFRLLFFLCPILALFSLYKFIKSKFNKTYMLLFLLFTSSFGHVLFHAVAGAKIDRYAYIAFPLALLGIILLIFPKNRKENHNLSERRVDNMIKESSNKILFVIPAYNESENIEKVLKEIRKDVNYADILVINDCSKDNTEEIVKRNNVKCITNIFNMRYAMAVQTGIKYAYENNYDYVIQFDADGQHIAKEAEKIYNHMKKTNCDIVIGSRYLKDMGYPCPLFRRIGTKVFEILIKLFCKKKIADPLSGFQCLNKAVISRYAKMGNYPEFPDANLIIEMLLEGYKIEEVPVKMRLREAGESMHGGIIKPIKYMINMIYTIVFILLRTPRKKDEN